MVWPSIISCKCHLRLSWEDWFDRSYMRANLHWSWTKVSFGITNEPLARASRTLTFCCHLLSQKRSFYPTKVCANRDKRWCCLYRWNQTCIDYILSLWCWMWSRLTSAHEQNTKSINFIACAVIPTSIVVYKLELKIFWRSCFILNIMAHF